MPTSLSFQDKLDARIGAADSLLCVGLDPVTARMPQGFDGSPEAVVSFCKEIVSATTDLAAAYKPNLAFFMALGTRGLEALHSVREAIPSDIPVILDGKLNDMGQTAKAYSNAVFDTLGFDALTVAPYLGEDALAPYLEKGGRGVIVLCKTSNPGSGDLQDLELASGELLHLHVADRCQEWDRRYPANVGMVVGATYPPQLAEVRRRCPDQVILLPGLGAQGGDAASSVRAGISSSGGRLLCSASRSIMYAGDTADFAEAARAAAGRLRDEINAHRRARRSA
ncbi:MAG TPA: orotidine-5'-phosphate decarboxylase [Thermomicrobiales bacterium]|nr:orotidine-5'-phosphate decarboxylase [Thermomicrobiales bacterium]